MVYKVIFFISESKKQTATFWLIVQNPVQSCACLTFSGASWHTVIIFSPSLVLTLSFSSGLAAMFISVPPVRLSEWYCPPALLGVHAVAERGSVALSLCMNPLLMVCVAAMRHIKQMFITVRQCPLTVEERKRRGPPDRRTGRLPPKCYCSHFPFSSVWILNRFTKSFYQINVVWEVWPSLSPGLHYFALSLLLLFYFLLFTCSVVYYTGIVLSELSVNITYLLKIIKLVCHSLTVARLILHLNWYG